MYTHMFAGEFAAAILVCLWLQGYLVGPPSKKMAWRLQVDCVCVVQWEATLHCVLLH